MEKRQKTPYLNTSKRITFWPTYCGGQIKEGPLIGLVDDDGGSEMCYHQINLRGELMTGTCFSKPEIMDNGKIRLHETWKWTSGDKSKGNSILEEIWFLKQL